MIDLCVVNYNTQDKLSRVWNNLLDDYDDYPHYKIWIADNGSTDGSVEWLQNHMKQEHVDYNSNIGYAAACNQLALKGDGEIIGLLNADVWFSSRDVKAIQKSFDENPDMAIMGPKQRDENGYITHGGIEGTEAQPKHRGWHQLDPADVYYRYFDEVVTISGSAYFIRRSVWNELTDCTIYKDQFPEAQGAFLPTPHYYEETFCSYHARAHGFKVYYDGRISIGHSWHASSKRGEEDRNLFLKSRDIFRSACDAHGIDHD